MRDTIDMAREADIDWHRHWNDDESNQLKVFEDLVRADERGSRPHSLQPGQMELSLRREYNGELFESRYRFTQEQVVHGSHNIIEETAGRLNAEINAAIRARENT